MANHTQFICLVDILFLRFVLLAVVDALFGFLIGTMVPDLFGAIFKSVGFK